MSQTIIMKPIPPPPPKDGPNVDPKGAFELTFQGFEEGQEVEVVFWEINDSAQANDHKEDTKLGSVRGKLVKHQETPQGVVLTLVPSKKDPDTFGEARIRFQFPKPGAQEHEAVTFHVKPDGNAGRNEGEYWEIQAQIVNPAVESPSFNVAKVNRALAVRGDKRQATYDWHAGNDVVFYNDASEDEAGTAGAFADLARAIEEAEHFIFIADWSFHPYMRLKHGDPAVVASTIGQKLLDKAKGNEKLLIAIHTWDHTNIGAPDAQNDSSGQILAKMAGGKRPANLLWRASSRTGQDGGAGLGWSHHQKFVVLDCPGPGGRREIKVFYGGLDLTKGRFDWSRHCILAETPPKSPSQYFLQKINGWEIGRVWDSNVDYDDWYNAEFEAAAPAGNTKLPRQPWHDIHAQLVGPTAWDVVREFVGRWNLDPTWTPTQGDNSAEAIEKVNKKFESLWEKEGESYKFVLPFEPRSGNWSAQVYRSMVKHHWGAKREIKSPMMPEGELKWILKGNVERSILDAYIKAIRQAEQFIYIETQYFIGSGNRWGRSSIANPLPEEIVNRINTHISNKKPFHAMIVMPMFPEGDPTSGAAVAQRIFEWNTMEYMARAVQAKCDQINDMNPDAEVLSWESYLSFYFLAQWEDQGTKSMDRSGDREKMLQKNERYMIYVHSKMMIVDDRYVIIGSANLNERSLAGGRDSEICISVWPSNDRALPACVAQVKAFRKRLWEEHFGPQMTILIPGWENPEMDCFQLKMEGIRNYNNFRYNLRTPNAFGIPSQGHICAWPLKLEYMDKAENGKLVLEKYKMYVEKDYEHIPDGALKDEWRWRPTKKPFPVYNTDIPE